MSKEIMACRLLKGKSIGIVKRNLFSANYKTTNSWTASLQKRAFCTARNLLRNEKPVDNLQSVKEEKPTVSEMGLKERLKLFGISIFGGTFGGTVGLGGNIVLVPLVSQLFSHRMTTKQVVATCLVTVVTAGFIGSMTLYFVGGKSVDLVAASIIALTASLTARFGVKLSSTLPDRSLKFILAFFMLFIAPLVGLIKKDESGEETKKEENASTEPKLIEDLKLPQTQELLSLIGLGSLVGIASGLLGVGGGVMAVPMLSFLWLSDKSPVKRKEATQQLIIGTSLAAMTVPSAVALYAHYTVGNVILPLAPILVGGSFIGAFIGAKIATEMDEKTLKNVFAITMLLLGGRQFYRALFVKK
ncbi:hypothetical protein ABK040_015165 [Willaertia magna]